MRCGRLRSVSLMLVLVVSFYMWVFIKAIEHVVMYKDMDVERLTEGDWIVNETIINKRKFLDVRDTVSQSQIDKIRWQYDSVMHYPSAFTVRVSTKFLSRSFNSDKNLLSIKKGDILLRDFNVYSLSYKKGHEFSDKRRS